LYREQNIRSITLSDARFGDLTGEYDTAKKTLLADNLSLPQFGQSKPGLITADEYTPEQDSTVLRCIGLAYDRAEEILAALAKEILSHEVDDELTVSQILEQINVTEFQFVFDSEEPVMQVIGGAELDSMT
ncbi:hypothetical protein RCJ22_02250, partial [Vibrio sp. FNV 38]|nr:hypothetical protein [Vibrio sp. FNV 38]